ncbi:nuclear transport factor 2 family protein [Fulvivirga ligni]|uniref:nuclear transport factor 2 family protein n=1 Tax=Fulvivirga ligni TaxID=2904246 RepID=UPI001F33E5AB|nr:nuclear transport factor 2 family protein [Fulvivirga ligni]UII20716.1 nuclear transport factor 2 family protein [Fulvivirga ligni]
MKHTNKEVAEAFSNGNFELTFPYLAENITWDVVGDSSFKGKQEVIQNCKSTSEYFQSVETNFNTEDTIVTDLKVVIRGTGEFLRDGERLNLIMACDVYDFNVAGELEKISSYCIPETK